MSDTVDDDATDPSADPSVDLRNFLSAEGHQTLELLEQVRGKYVTSPGDAVCMKALTKLILNAGMRANTALPYSRTNRAEGRILVITGESGAGKSRRLMRTLRRHPALEGQDLAGPDSPVVVVNVPSPCTLKLLGREVLHATGYPLERELLENLVWERVRRRLDRGNKLIVVFDEMQHITRKLNSDEINKVSDTIKNLINNLTWRVSIIVCGLPKVADFIHRDRQLERRAQFIHIDSLTMPGDNAVIAAMVTKLAAVADLIVEADIATNLAPRLIHAACNQWGVAIALTHEAIQTALRPDYLALDRHDDEIDVGDPQQVGPDGTLTLNHFAEAYRGLLGCTDEENPFVSRDWITIRIAGPTVILDAAKDRNTQTGAMGGPS
ncbi:hypothetical protein GOFOIKOB_5177 [Methylobacterium tardum]|uniref:AAA+ ATPase domain-containing protein n=1 Tax=Methylobacterium tardum TaxID=374432 RepID=A0AA37WT10_9HYPH|nr:ATP-binding protein [Methylobacterium tardum]URD38092.1 ATP-binding protein [Methylobacterium tardum]GJE52109.1 hypothetical protein GOFOIKOB_5177 [Methylobacterium tardum]GLS71664.1 hypothetical protein GCM10007890_36770 [Methylobacterium tardum]